MNLVCSKVSFTSITIVDLVKSRERIHREMVIFKIVAKLRRFKVLFGID